MKYRILELDLFPVWCQTIFSTGSDTSVIMYFIICHIHVCFHYRGSFIFFPTFISRDIWSRFCNVLLTYFCPPFGELKSVLVACRSERPIFLSPNILTKLKCLFFLWSVLNQSLGLVNLILIVIKYCNYVIYLGRVIYLFSTSDCIYYV